MEWIITAQPSGRRGYDIIRAFEENNQLDWHRSKPLRNIAKGDVVFIYVGRPYSRIMFRTVCVMDNVPSEIRFNDRNYWNDLTLHDSIKDYFRIEKSNVVDSDELSIFTLIEKRLVKGNIQGSLKSDNNPKLFEYVNQHFDGKNNEYKYPNEVNEVIYEGATSKVTVNRYERNQVGRQKCIDYYKELDGSIRCQVCGFDFGKKYGPEFEGIIEVHHITPISEIGDEYKLDPVKDLIPVCPNCHTAIHAQKMIDINTIKNRLKLAYKK